MSYFPIIFSYLSQAVLDPVCPTPIPTPWLPQLLECGPLTAQS